MHGIKTGQWIKNVEMFECREKRQEDAQTHKFIAITLTKTYIHISKGGH